MLLFLDEEAKLKARQKKRALLNPSVSTSQPEEAPGSPKAATSNQEQAGSDHEDSGETANNSQVASIQDDDDDEEDDEDQEYETITSRFVERLLRHLFHGFADSKATVRIRCCQIIALSISSMGELE